MNRFKKQRQQQQEAQAQGLGAASASVADEAAVDEGEEDYMSEALLAQLEKQQKQQQQQASSSTIGRKRPKPSSAAAASGQPPPLSRKAKQEQAEAKLQEGLKTPLPEDNPGLRLLKLMGFKKGTGLGKSCAGIAEPLQIVRRLGREGIGVHEGKQERAGRREELARLRAEWAEKRKADFTQAMSNRFEERRVAGHLAKAMKTVETLDTRAGRSRSCLWWSSEHGGDGQEGGEEAGGEAGAEAEAAATAEAAAPKEEQGEEEGDDEQDLWPSLTNAEKLNVVTAYLRAEENYCLWCGHQFDGPEELARECPGEAEEDH